MLSPDALLESVAELVFQKQQFTSVLAQWNKVSLNAEAAAVRSAHQGAHTQQEVSNMRKRTTAGATRSSHHQIN